MNPKRIFHPGSLLITALALSIGQAGTPPASLAAGKVLVVFSGKSTLTLQEGKTYETGFYLVELATPLDGLLKAAYEPVYASPTGARPAMDLRSDQARYFPSPEEHLRLKALVEQELSTKPLRKLKDLSAKELESFKAIFLPGGHAPMEDLYRDPELGRILRHFHDKAKPTALICHAPVALLSASRPGEPWIYSGYRMTVFSNAEEAVAEKTGLQGKMTFYAETDLRKAGGKVTVAKPWTSNVVRDRELITGQNPMSDHEFTKALLEALSK